MAVKSSIYETIYRKLGFVYIPSDGASVVRDNLDVNDYILELLCFKFASQQKVLWDTTSNEVRTAITDVLLSCRAYDFSRKVKRIANSAQSVYEVRNAKKELYANGAPKKTVLKIVNSNTKGSYNVVKTIEELFMQSLPFSQQDLSDLRYMIDAFSFTTTKVPEIRENKINLAGVYDWVDWQKDANINDVLRMAYVLSGGSANLAAAELVKFKLSRKQRRVIINAMEKVLQNNKRAYFDVADHLGNWKALVKHLHVFEYNAPEFRKLANAIYNGNVISLNSVIDYNIKHKNLDTLLGTLKNFPGFFARKLNYVIKELPDNREQILSAFAEIANKVSLRVLVQARNNFSSLQGEESTNKVVTISGTTPKTRVVDSSGGYFADVVTAIDKGITARKAGVKVYFTGDASEVAVPTSNRVYNSGFASIAQGTKVAYPSAKELQIYSHWRNTDSGNRVDLDISCRFFKEDFTDFVDLAYYSTDLNSYLAKYSGDIRNAPNGAEEYITIDVDKALIDGYRYVMLYVNSYTLQQFSAIPECSAGLRITKSEDKSVDSSVPIFNFALDSDSKEVVSFILDLKAGKAIWLNVQTSFRSSYSNMKDSVLSDVKNLMQQDCLYVRNFAEKLGMIVVTDEKDADLVIDPMNTTQVMQLLD